MLVAKSCLTLCDPRDCRLPCPSPSHLESPKRHRKETLFNAPNNPNTQIIPLFWRRAWWREKIHSYRPEWILKSDTLKVDWLTALPHSLCRILSQIPNFYELPFSVNKEILEDWEKIRRSVSLFVNTNKIVSYCCSWKLVTYNNACHYW